MWLLKRLLQTACFFALFAFALNNQHDITVHFFFGTSWRGPLVLLVLAVFAGGVLLGAMGSLPRWWRGRHSASGPIAAPSTAPEQATTTLHAPVASTPAAPWVSAGSVPPHGS